MTNLSPFIKRLKLAATKAAARAAAAKTQVRAAKAQLKQARKVFKTEKKAAKQARRKVDAATPAKRRAPRPAATLELKPAIRKPAATKPVPATRKTPKAPRKTPKAARKIPKAARKTSPKPPPRKLRAPGPAKPRVKVPAMRSAAEVAKSVFERLHAPPPTLPPQT